MEHDPKTSFDSAVEAHRNGELAQAESLYREFLAVNPGHLDAEYLLGTALLQLGRFAEAVERLKIVIAKRGDVPDAHNNLGVAYKALGDWEHAARSFQAALKINPQYGQALFNLGAVMEHRGLFADAEKCYRRVLALQPDEETRWKLAEALKEQQKWADAEAVYRELPADGERRLDQAVQLAFVLARQERLDDAAAIYREVLDKRPDFAEIHNSLSYVYERQGKLVEAEGAARAALKINPSLPEAHNNLGIALRSRHRLNEAIEAFRQAVALNPQFALAEFNLATTHLFAGNYSKGWPGYEKRLEALGLPPREFSQPRWNGEPIPSGRLFVFSDQGFGDAIQFSRFLPAVKERFAGEVVFECQPELQPLMLCMPGIGVSIAEGDELPPFDCWIPLASLPGALGVSLENLADFPPTGFSFSRDRSRLSAKPQAALQTITTESRLSVGLVWRGNPGQARDVVRSCPLEALRPILDCENVTFISLQVGEVGRRELTAIPEEDRPLSVDDEITEFAATARIIDSLDLVIAVDTAAAHLAGSLGKETWTLLCHTPDWRWGVTGDRSPWYPSMRLFRQPQWGDWAGVVSAVRGELLKEVADNGPGTA
jgi:tetratricopeptide (TPR) repeat protein